MHKSLQVRCSVFITPDRLVIDQSDSIMLPFRIRHSRNNKISNLFSFLCIRRRLLSVKIRSLYIFILFTLTQSHCWLNHSYRVLTIIYYSLRQHFENCCQWYAPIPEQISHLTQSESKKFVFSYEKFTIQILTEHTFENLTKVDTLTIGIYKEIIGNYLWWLVWLLKFSFFL